MLVYFRDRLEEKNLERVIFDGVVELLVELGLVKKRGKQRLDSTHVLGYVKKMSRLECAVETLRLGLEALAKEVRSAERPEFWERLRRSSQRGCIPETVLTELTASWCVGTG